MNDDFCLIHGYGFMRNLGHHLLPNCTECERLTEVKRETMRLRERGASAIDDLKKEISL